MCYVHALVRCDCIPVSVWVFANDWNAKLCIPTQRFNVPYGDNDTGFMVLVRYVIWEAGYRRSFYSHANFDVAVNLFFSMLYYLISFHFYSFNRVLSKQKKIHYMSLPTNTSYIHSNGTALCRWISACLCELRVAIILQVVDVGWQILYIALQMLILINKMLLLLMRTSQALQPK